MSNNTNEAIQNVGVSPVNTIKAKKASRYTANANMLVQVSGTYQHSFFVPALHPYNVRSEAVGLKTKIADCQAQQKEIKATVTAMLKNHDAQFSAIADYFVAQLPDGYADVVEFKAGAYVQAFPLRDAYAKTIANQMKALGNGLKVSEKTTLDETLENVKLGAEFSDTYNDDVILAKLSSKVFVTDKAGKTKAFLSSVFGIAKAISENNVTDGVLSGLDSLLAILTQCLPQAECGKTLAYLLQIAIYGIYQQCASETIKALQTEAEAEAKAAMMARSAQREHEQETQRLQTIRAAISNV